MRKIHTQENINPDIDVSLLPPDFLYYPGEAEECFNRRGRRWQSAATVSKTGSGRLFTAYNAGGIDEGPNNYIAMSYSDDDGLTWKNDFLIIDHPECVRMHEPILWTSPDGILRFFWAQSYVYWDGRGGVWAAECENPDAPLPRFVNIRRLADGVMACKPTVRSDGFWLYPVSIWHNYKTRFHSIPERENSSVYISYDGGRSIEFLGAAYHEKSTFDENIICERADKSLLMLIRTDGGIGYSESFDGGRNWSEGKDYFLPGPSARMYLSKFPDGEFFLVYHYKFNKRDHMTVLLSHDEGRSFSETLLLDERFPVAYPDGFVDADGRVYIVYDRERYGDKDIHLAVFRKEDVLAGACVSAGSAIKRVVCHSDGARRTEEEKKQTKWPRAYCQPLDSLQGAVKQYFK